MGQVQHRIGEGIVRLTCIDDYPTGALIAAWESAIADPACPKPLRVLLDVRRSASLLSRPRDELRETAAYFAAASLRHRSTCAILVDGLARYGLMRMAATFADLRGARVRVFRDAARAELYLRTAVTD